MQITALGKVTILVVVLGAAVGVWRILPATHRPPGTKATANEILSGPVSTPAAVQLRGLIGGEKAGLLEDPQLVSLLSSRYGIALSFEKVGSLDIVTGSTKGMDFIWPSSQVALDIFKARGGMVRKSEVVLNSPLVIYSWAKTTDALMKQGIVQRQGGGYSIVDMPRLVGLMTEGKRWKDINLDFYGKIVVASTDPVRSNSGMMFAGLLSTIVNKGDVVTRENVDKTIPLVASFFRSQGYMQHGSADLFNQFLNMGEGSYPLAVGYESQLVEYGQEHPQYKDVLASQVRILYPRPTVWSSHPFIALTPDGERLLTALQDPEVQKLAWSAHGFRSSSMLTGKKANYPGIPDLVTSVVPLPATPAMQKILKALQ